MRRGFNVNKSEQAGETDFYVADKIYFISNIEVKS